VELEVEARQRRVEPLAEELDAGGVAEVDAVDREPVLPGREVGLARVAGRRVAREARERHDPAAGAEEEHRRLVADLHARAGDERHPAAEVHRGGAAGVVLVAARGAQLVVKGVEAPELRLADVALAGLCELRRVVGRRLACRGRPHRKSRPPARGVASGGRQLGERRRERRRVAEPADAGPLPQGAVPGLPLVALATPQRLAELLPLPVVGAGDLPREPLERLAGRRVETGEGAPVLRDAREDAERLGHLGAVEERTSASLPGGPGALWLARHAPVVAESAARFQTRSPSPRTSSPALPPGRRLRVARIGAERLRRSP